MYTKECYDRTRHIEALIGFLIGSVWLLIFAFVVRFQAIGHGALISGVERLSPNIMSASLVLGRSFSKSMALLAPPLLRKSMLAGGILVFVDVMKELPMTLLLRPFNYETLSTYVYQFAKDEMLEESAIAALKQAYRCLYRSSNDLQTALGELQLLGSKHREVEKLSSFVESSERGIIR